MIEITGIDDVIYRLTEISSTLPKRQEDLLQKLVDIGEREMQGFYNPKGDYSENDSVVEKSVSADSAEVSASGTKVTFIEYGAGNATTSPSALGFEGPEYKPGSWSETHAKQYSRFGMWFYRRKPYVEQLPERYAYKAYNTIMNEFHTVGKDFFKT